MVQKRDASSHDVGHQMKKEEIIEIAMHNPNLTTTEVALLKIKLKNEHKYE